MPETLNLNDLEKAALEKALQVTGGSILASAQLLGIGKTTAYRKVKKYGLAASTGPTFCPNCGRQLPRHTASSREELASSLAAITRPVNPDAAGSLASG